MHTFREAMGWPSPMGTKTPTRHKADSHAAGKILTLPVVVPVSHWAAGLFWAFEANCYRPVGGCPVCLEKLQNGPSKAASARGAGTVADRAEHDRDYLCWSSQTLGRDAGARVLRSPLLAYSKAPVALVGLLQYPRYPKLTEA